MLGKGRSYSEKASERGDLFATQLIENIIHDRTSKYNPYMLDGNAEISYRTASVALRKAHVTGLSSLHRTNTCSLTEEGNRLFINANLGAGPLMYRRQIVLRFGDFERKVAVLVSLIDMKVSVDFNVEKKTGRNGFLLDFAVNELNGFKLSVNGSSYFDWAINLFFSFWALVLGRIVRNLLENELEQYILNRLPNYQFPVEGTSYRNETKFNNRHEGVQSNETSLSESFYTKQSHETPKWSRMSPIDKSSVFHGHNSTEYGTGKDFGSNPQIRHSRCFPETKERTTEMSNFYWPNQIDENIFKPSIIETGKFFKPSRSSDSDRRAQIDYLMEKTVNENRRKEKTKRTNKNKHASVKSCKHCQYPEGNLSALNTELMSCGTDKFQNQCLISCTIDEFEKHLKVSANVFSREYECQIEDPESIKSLPFSEKHGSEVNEKILFKYVKVHTGEVNEDSQLKADEGYSADDSSNSEAFIITFDFPAQSLGLCSGSLNKNSCNKVSKDKAEEKCDRISVRTSKKRELFRTLNILMKKLESKRIIAWKLRKFKLK